MMNITDLIIRPENKNDYREVENLTREAFWDLYKPGCDEHLIVHKMRDSSDFIQELDLVVVLNDRIVGNILYSRAKVVDDNNRKNEVIMFGPVSVLPSLQNKGIGSALIKQTIEMAKYMGYKAIFIFGNPAYYHRFGFENAAKFGITTPDGTNFEEFMGLELFKDSLKGISGKLYYSSLFEVSQADLEEFEKGFPFKEKHVTDTQLKM
jgi:predicted N-acetyltransferase YhbS